MRRSMSTLALICLILMSSIAAAQDPPRRRQQPQDPNAVYLVDKEKVSEFLGLTEEQKEAIFTEIDTIVKIMEPIQNERREISQQLRSGRLDRQGMRKIREEMEKKYEGETKKIKELVAAIEELLNDEQKKKFEKVIKPSIFLQRRRPR